ncbi:MAG: glycosyltransferase family 9 protein [Candidatus Omnitrophica bacterium]|nr:glycosyltransferase family 9 protein [Candidatus Omnitrophota bacterium]
MRYYYRKRRYIILAYIIDCLGWVLSFLRMIPKRKYPENIKNILLVRLDHLGDVLYILPALTALRHKYPNAQITLLAASWGYELVKDNRDINEIIVYDAPWFQRGKKKGGILGLMKLVWRLRKNKYELAIDFKGYLWNILLIWLSGAKYKISYNDVGGKYLLDKALLRRTDLHAVLQNLEMLKAIGITSDQRPEISINIGNEEAAVIKLMDQFNLKGKKMIAIHCGAGRESKCWPIDKFNELIDRIFVEYPGHEVVLVGGKDEAELVSRLSFKNKSPISLVGLTKLKELAAFLAKCELFIGNDSAPAHLAAIVRIPVIVFFSLEDDPVQWAPWGKKVIVLQKTHHEFSPLAEEKIQESLALITTGDVLESINKFVKRGR